MSTQIKEALESLRDPLVHNEALNDCLALVCFNQVALEKHFLHWLWLPDGEEYKTAADEGYAKQLSQIEEYLIFQGLIYNE